MTDAHRFLETLFGAAPAELWLYIWTAPDRVSRWFPADRHDLAARYAVEVGAAGHDVYVGAALSPQAYGPNARCKAENTAGIVALWVDLDIAGPAHKKTNLPPTQEAAQALLESMGLKPTALVHSGHGLQAWWCLKEPWLFSGPDDRTKATALVAGWQGALRRKAETRGWTVDSTHDLAHVMRVPGTRNWKGIAR